MPLTRVSPIGQLRRWIAALRPNDQSLFLEPLGGWLHRIMSKKTIDPSLSYQEDQLSISQKMSSREPLGLGGSYLQADVADDSAIKRSGNHRADSPQVEDVVAGSEGQDDDATTPRPDTGPKTQPEFNPTERNVADDPGAMSPGFANTFDDLEATPEVDSTEKSEERPVQPLAKTMVETMPRSRAGSAEDSNYLPDNPAELFVRKEFVNPQVKALLYGLDSINCRELADELHEFARNIGASEGQYPSAVSGHESESDA